MSEASLEAEAIVKIFLSFLVVATVSIHNRSNGYKPIDNHSKKQRVRKLSCFFLAQLSALPSLQTVYKVIIDRSGNNFLYFRVTE